MLPRLAPALVALAAAAPLPAAALSLVTITGTLYESAEFNTPSGIFAAGGSHALSADATFVMTMTVEDGATFFFSDYWMVDAHDVTLTIHDGGALVYAFDGATDEAAVFSNETFGDTPAEPPFNVREGVWDHLDLVSLPDDAGLQVGFAIFAPLGSLAGEGFAAAALNGWVGGIIAVMDDPFIEEDEAAASITSITVAPIPLPAALPLTLAGLGALAALRRRARAA